MKKLILTIIILSLSILPTFAQDTPPIIYVREGCPHCAKVKEFVSANDIETEVQYIETYNNEENQALMDSEFERLNVPQASRGVPFMVYDQDQYEIGDVPIIEYLANKHEIEIVEPEYSTAAADYLFLGLGGLFILGILGYGVYTVFMTKDN
jgi:glutaredoxin